MLTVTYHSEVGHETTFEASSVRKIAEPKGESAKMDEFDYPPGVLVELTGDGAKRVHYPFRKCAQSGDEQPCIFVMNRYGATVAKYTL